MLELSVMTCPRVASWPQNVIRYVRMHDYANYQQQWENAAAAEFERLSSLPLAALISQVRASDFGNYYQLWRAISSKATLQEAGWVLFDVLDSNVDYLCRYHSAAALINISAGVLSDWKPEQLSADRAYPVRQNLKQVEKELVAAIGKQA
jgi:hypothetical protein